MNDLIFSPIDKRQLHEIAEEVASRIQLQPPTQEDELIQIPEAMRLLGRSRTTINNWRREGFLKEQVINTAYLQVTQLTEVLITNGGFLIITFLLFRNIIEESRKDLKSSLPRQTGLPTAGRHDAGNAGRDEPQ
ncbi:MAG: hypothetical protein WD431_21395 [Cyclobacteriaceae bacterium]